MIGSGGGALCGFGFGAATGFAWGLGGAAGAAKVAVAAADRGTGRGGDNGALMAASACTGTTPFVEGSADFLRALFPVALFGAAAAGFFAGTRRLASALRIRLTVSASSVLVEAAALILSSLSLSKSSFDGSLRAFASSLTRMG
jgi:hypothetical protein